MRKSALRTLLFAATAICAGVEPLSADTLYVWSSSIDGSSHTGQIGAYGTDGSVINASLVSLSSTSSYGMAASGGDIFFAYSWPGAQNVAEYGSDGTLINASLVAAFGDSVSVAVSGSTMFVGLLGGTILDVDLLSGSYYPVTVGSMNIQVPLSMGIAGSNLFLDDMNTQKVVEYSPVDGLVNSNVIAGVSAYYMAVSESDLFVSTPNGIAEYGTDGTVINANLLPGVEGRLAVDGSDIFVVNQSNGGVGEYGTDGSVINSNLITGLSTSGGLISIAVDSSTPEPSTLVLGGAGLVLGLLIRRCRRGASSIG